MYIPSQNPQDRIYHGVNTLCSKQQTSVFITKVHWKTLPLGKWMVPCLEKAQVWFKKVHRMKQVFHSYMKETDNLDYGNKTEQEENCQEPSSCN